MRRVVVTGMGVVSCLGNDLDSVSAALRDGRSGIRAQPDHKEAGLNSQVAGNILDTDAFSEFIDRRHQRFMGQAAFFSSESMRQAIEDAGLTPEMISNPRTGLIAGSGGGSPASVIESADIMRERGLRRVGPYRVTQTMNSTVSACLATSFGIRGVNYSISSACATSAHCIGNAMEQIRSGRQDVVFAGGGEEVHWTLSMLFDAMGALSCKYNDAPATASRPYDANRDGFVIAGGGGMLVIEDLEHAQKRGARIHAELVGYGATSDGVDMVAPSGDGAVACMRQAMESCDGDIDYINTHGTSTPAGDIRELNAIREVFGDDMPPISSTKSLSGHSLGAAGVHEAIYVLLMMRDDFIAASANIETLDPEADGFPLLTETLNQAPQRALSNSFGFGGTNACLILEKSAS